MRSRPLLFALLASVAVLAAAFLACAATRRLNFDEALALRSGWLAVEGIPGAPRLYTPETALLGLLGGAVDDPAGVFLAARLVAAVGVLASLAAAVGAAGLVPGLLAALLTFLQGSFAVHGYEVRYDAALLVGWLVAYAALAHRREPRFGLAGVCAGWLAVHHLKGALLACALAVVASVVCPRRAARRAVGRFLGGAAATVAAWLIINSLVGRLAWVWGTYSDFWRLGRAVPRLAWPWTALASSFAADALWWLAVTVGVVAAVARWRGGAPLAERDPSLVAALFALPPLALLFIHPHPWPYMLALPAPFLALVTAHAAAGARRPALPLAVGVTVALVASLAGASPLDGYRRAWAAPRRHQEEALRLLRRLAQPGDRVIDPSGLAYFLPPCTPAWYTDTLFRELAEEGGWMTGLADADLSRCPWIVGTYRLRMLTAAQQRHLAGRYTLFPGGIGLLVGDPRGEELARRSARLTGAELLNFW